MKHIAILVMGDPAVVRAGRDGRSLALLPANLVGTTRTASRKAAQDIPPNSIDAIPNPDKATISIRFSSPVVAFRKEITIRC
jgi:hypothetical protein